MPKFLAGMPKEPVSEAVLAGLMSQCPHAIHPVVLNVHSHPTAVPGQCYGTVMNYLHEGGKGQMLCGWLLWELPGVFLTLEHHAVVESGDGSLLDVSRHYGNEFRVMFAPDPSAQIDDPKKSPVAGTTRYAPLTSSPLGEELCDLKRESSVIYRSLLAQGIPPQVAMNYLPLHRIDNRCTGICETLTSGERIERLNSRQQAERRKRMTMLKW